MEISSLTKRYRLICDGFQLDSVNTEEKLESIAQVLRERNLPGHDSVQALPGRVLKEAGSQFDLLSDAQALRMLGCNVSIVLAKDAAVSSHNSKEIEAFSKPSSVPVSTTASKQKLSDLEKKEKKRTSRQEISTLEFSDQTGKSLYDSFMKHAESATKDSRDTGFYRSRKEKHDPGQRSSSEPSGFYGAQYREEKGKRSPGKETITESYSFAHSSISSKVPKSENPKEGFFGSGFQKAPPGFDFDNSVPDGEESESYENISVAIEEGVSLADIQRMKRAEEKEERREREDPKQEIRKIVYNDPALANALEKVDQYYVQRNVRQSQNWVKSGCMFMMIFFGIMMGLWFYLLISFEPGEESRGYDRKPSRGRYR